MLSSPDSLSPTLVSPLSGYISSGSRVGARSGPDRKRVDCSESPELRLLRVRSIRGYKVRSFRSRFRAAEVSGLSFFSFGVFGQLVPLGYRRRRPCTCSLSTSSSLTALIWKSNLGAGFVLRCFQHLSYPDAATRPCPSAGQPAHRRSVQHGPLVLVSVLLKSRRPQQIETELSHDVLNPARVPL